MELEGLDWTVDGRTDGRTTTTGWMQQWEQARKGEKRKEKKRCRLRKGGDRPRRATTEPKRSSEAGSAAEKVNEGPGKLARKQTCSPSDLSAKPVCVCEIEASGARH